MEKKGSFWHQIPACLPQEMIETIIKTDSIRIERIISQGHKSEPGFWYDQCENEWVMLLQGIATLEFEKDSLQLLPGDYINIPAHCKHRIAATDDNLKTIWLTIFYR
jgi:cupin 2 domain-containing protein